MPQEESRPFDLLEWAQKNSTSIREVMQILDFLPERDLDAAAKVLFNTAPLVVTSLPMADRQRLVELFENLHFFQGRPLPEDLASPYILMPGQPFPLAVAILRPLMGHKVTCVSSCREYDPELDGNQRLIATTVERFAGSSWHDWATTISSFRPLEDQYGLMTLAIMVASDGRFQLQDASTERATFWNQEEPTYAHFLGDPGKVMLHARYGTTGKEADDIRYWMKLVLNGELEFDTSGSLVIATDPMAIETVGFHAQENILPNWPGCSIYLTAPEIPASERLKELPRAVKALGAQMFAASYSSHKPQN